jgi:hypothetical protein
MQDLLPDEDSPQLRPGQVWQPRGQGLQRQILSNEKQDDNTTLIRYRTAHGDFTTSAGNFRFWISRLSASVVDSENPAS